MATKLNNKTTKPDIKQKKTIIENPDVKVIKKNLENKLSKTNTETKNFIITGGAGLLGTHIIYELIENYVDNLDNLFIYNLYHKGSENKLLIFNKKELYYPKTQKFSLHVIKNRIIHIPLEIDKDNLGISTKHIDLFKNASNLEIIHAAAITDFRNKDSIKKKLTETNVKGTEYLIKFLTQLFNNQFTFNYISSVYACGSKQGIINPNESSRSFHNYYEESKYNAEIALIKICTKYNISYRIYRFPGISGRLIYKPIGYTTKYDIFYAWLRFFYNLKKKMGITINQKLIIPIRIKIKKGQGINICPVDYGAKLLVNLLLNNCAHEHIHIVANNNFDHRELAMEMLKKLNITGYSFVEEIPLEKDMNEIEKIYYRFVGDIFEGYLNDGPMVFDNSNIYNEYINIVKICPEINKISWGKLIDYAFKMEFKV